MPLVSAVIITYNESANIRKDAFYNFYWCDEIIIVDSFSTDGTDSHCQRTKTATSSNEHSADSGIRNVSPYPNAKMNGFSASTRMNF